MNTEINEDICESCGFLKQDSTMKDMNGKRLCAYCWFRNRHSIPKMVLLSVLNEAEKPLTIKEIAYRMGKHEIAGGKRTWTYFAVHGILKRLRRDKNKLVYQPKNNFERSEKTGRGRKTLKTFSITDPKGKRYLKGYLKQWDSGKFVELKPSKWYKKMMRRPENKMKKRSIKSKIRNGEYGRFEFTFV